jgi:competence protein ComEC
MPHPSYSSYPPRVFSSVFSSPSKFFAAALGLFSLGVAVGPYWPLPGIIPALVVALVVSFCLSGRRGRMASLLLACFAAGVWRYGQAALPSGAPTVADAVERSVNVSGTVTAEVDARASGPRTVVDGIRVDGEPVLGKALLWLPEYPPVGYGDAVAFDCHLELPEPIGTFRYDRYLRSRGIFVVCYRPSSFETTSGDRGVVSTLLAVKRTVAARLAAIVPEPHASFLSGLIFGGSSALSAEMKDDFAATGTSHILAASGFNVSLFTMAFLAWVTHTALGRRRGAYVAAGLLAAYVLAAGATAAVVRAGIMGAVVLVGFLVRRKPSALNMLLLALAAMLLWNPLLLRDDVGFQLSFAATAAMLCFAGRVEERCLFVPKVLGLRASFAASLAAIVATFPILLWHFGTASLTAPVVNLVVLPLVPVAMSLTGIALIAAFVHPSLGIIAALPAWAVSSVILHVVSWFGAW